MPRVKNYINKELLIDLVHKRPAIWNKKMNIYQDKLLKNMAWREICAILNPEFDQMNETDSHFYIKKIIKIWAQTRDSWIRSLNEKKGSHSRQNYIYHKQMLFLKDVVSLSDKQDRLTGVRKDTEGEIKVEENDINADIEFDTYGGEDDLLAERMYSSSNEEESQEINRKHRRIIEEVDVLNSRSDVSNFDTLTFADSRISNIERVEENRHMLFFKSILPSLSSLDDDQTLEFQSGVISLLQSIRKRKHTDGW